MSDPVLGWDELVRFGTVALVVWSAAWFLFNQQNKIKDLLIEKLEYHERHDDQRFDNVRKDIIDLRIQQARYINKASKYMENGNGNTIRN